MAGKCVTEYMQALFAPLVAAAVCHRPREFLKTAVLPEDRRHDQYRRLAATKSIGGEHVLSPARLCPFSGFRCKDDVYLCIQREGLDQKGSARLSAWGEASEITETQLDKSGFLFLVYALQGTYKPKSEFQSQDAAEKLLTYVQSGNVGDSIYDLLGWYRDVAVFAIPEEHVFRTRSNYGVAANLAASLPDFRQR